MPQPIRKRRRREKREVMELDITSLLDILVIILVFLLKNYSASDIVINVPSDIKIPESASMTSNQAGINMQVSKEKIFVEDKMVWNMTNDNSQNLDHDGSRMIPLFEELVAIKETSERINKTIGRTKDFSGKINLVMDKEVEYDFLKKLMYTAAEAGYTSFNFVVLGTEG